MKRIAIVYGTTTGNTKSIAEQIKVELAEFDVKLFDIANISLSELTSFSNIILGTSTWGMGDIQEDWEAALNKLKGANLNGKVVALFGCGDSSCYPDSFVDAIGTLYSTIKSSGCKVIGKTDPDGYSFTSSAAVENGWFVGLPIDVDSENDKTNDRISCWIKAIAPEFI